VSYVPQKLAVDWTLPLTVRRFMRLTGEVSASAAESAMASTGVSHLNTRKCARFQAASSSG
jgi:zinc transport system ATP-binding protein